MLRDLGDLVPVSPYSTAVEQVYVCPDCAKPKLYVNSRTWKWFCHACGVGGSIRGENLSSSTPFNDHLSQAEFFDYHRVELPQITNFLQLRIHQRVLTLSLPYLHQKQHDLFTTNGLAVFSYTKNGKTPVGKQVYQPTSVPRYKNSGKRGITWLSSHWVHTLSVPERRYLLCEGMWDALHMWMYSYYRLDVLFTGGNDLTHSQLQSIASIVPEGSDLYLAIDNDKLAPYLKLHSGLASHEVRAKFLPPPYQGVKDWDEALKRYHLSCRDNLSDFLGIKL